MMLFLIDDVLLYYGNLLHREGESSVSLSPPSKQRKRGITFQPTVCGIFQPSDKLRNGKIGRQRDKQVNVVRHTADAVQFGAMAGNISMSVGVQLTLMLLIDGGNAAISAENDVVNEIGLTHDEAKVALISGSITRTPQLGSPPATISVIFYPQ